MQKSGTRLMQGTGITNAWWQMLSELRALEKRVTVSELARHIGLTRQAIQRLADDMTNDGLVKFAENPGDARAMHLLVTEAGKQLRLLEARRLMLAENYNAITAADRVGYESPSQFSREYARLFGAPPIRDIDRLFSVG